MHVVLRIKTLDTGYVICAEASSTYFELLKHLVHHNVQQNDYQFKNLSLRKYKMCKAKW